MLEWCWRDLLFSWNVPPVRAVFSAWGGQTDRQTWSEGQRRHVEPSTALRRRRRARQTNRHMLAMYTLCVGAARRSYRIWKARASCSGAHTASPTHLAPSRAARAPCGEVESPAVSTIATRKYHRAALRRARPRRPDAHCALLHAYFACHGSQLSLPLLGMRHTVAPGGWAIGSKEATKEGQQASFSLVCFSRAIKRTCRLCSCWRIFTWAAFLSALAAGRNGEETNGISDMPNAAGASTFWISQVTQASKTHW